MDQKAVFLPLTLWYWKDSEQVWVTNFHLSIRNEDVLKNKKIELEPCIKNQWAQDVSKRLE